MKTFILRVETDETGCVVGIVERVRNGEKERFLGYGMLIEIVSRMSAADELPPPRTVNRPGGATVPSRRRLLMTWGAPGAPQASQRSQPPRRSRGGARSARACVVLALVAMLGATGCASTLTASFGPLGGDHMLVTLVVSEDRQVVARECRRASTSPTVLGCQMSWPIRLPDGNGLRTMKIVRYTDSLPSPLAFEIDIHELCHAVAALQLVDDPCHTGNNGVAQALRDGGSAMVGF